MSTIELSSGSATLTPRADYLLVVEHGTLASGEEVFRYVSELEQASQRFQLRRLLVDARSEIDDGARHEESRAAMWRWIRAQRAFDMIGYVLRDEMTIARVNMTALSERLTVRAFGQVADGHRWLARQRASSTAIPASRPAHSSSVPPPPPTTRTPVPMRGTPTPPEASPRPGRQTARTSALSSQEADAILSGTTARNTARVAKVDEASAEQLVSTPRKPGR